jgi:uncharacterized protein (TIGR03435 family)
MIRPIGYASLIVLMTSGLFAQPAQQPRAFEVASIKVHDGPLQSMGISTSGTRLTAEAETLNGLVMWAYNLKNYPISFARSISGDDVFYDIFAKAEGDALPTMAEFRQMLQTLLTDRFHLKVHREMREVLVYALVVGKNGPKFKESAPDAIPASDTGVNGRNQYMKATKGTMEDLAHVLPVLVDRPVVDRTELTGTYDYRMEATPGFRINNNPELGDISVFTAVQEQLGLKLEPQKAPVEILVVDHIEKPSAN